MSSTRVAILLGLLDEAFEKKAWHGPNLRNAIRGLTPNQAFWRPEVQRHSAWELMLHCAYWKFVALRRLTGVRNVAFGREGRNFFTVVSPTDAAWRADVKLLAGTHRNLREAVERAPDTAIRTKSRMISGVAMHDVYHAGQIQLLRRLYEG